MNMHNLRWGMLGVLLVLPCGAQASTTTTIITGTIQDWDESGPGMTIGDGFNHVSLGWSVNTFDRGWFYWGGDSEVAFATGVTEISQITDASLFIYTQGAIGPYCDADCDPDGVGDFLIWRNIGTGHYGALRVDDIYPINPNNPDPAYNTALNGTWWFQSDGTGNFSPIPEPSTLTLLGLGSLALVMVRRRR